MRITANRVLKAVGAIAALTMLSACAYDGYGSGYGSGYGYASGSFGYSTYGTGYGSGYAPHYVAPRYTYAPSRGYGGRAHHWRDGRRHR